MVPTDDLMWLASCPVEGNGLVRALITATGDVVLICEECGEVWLTPDSIEVVPGLQPRAPDWTVGPGVAIAPGTTAWASFDDLPEDWRTYPWRSPV